MRGLEVFSRHPRAGCCGCRGEQGQSLRPGAGKESTRVREVSALQVGLQQTISPRGGSQFGSQDCYLLCVPGTLSSLLGTTLNWGK